MVSTTVFAPAVRAVQPAFEYEYIYDENNKPIGGSGVAKVYFTLSYNSIADVTGLRYTITDPNKSGVDGIYSVVNDTINQTTYVEINIECTRDEDDNVANVIFKQGSTTISAWGQSYPLPLPTNGEFYVPINFLPSVSIYRLLTVNQFYQVQIELKDSTGNWSLPSQATLIRPIPRLNNSACEVRLSSDYTKLVGQIEYQDSSTIESIASCKYIITNGLLINPIVYYTSPAFPNFLGLRFEIPMSYWFNEEESYSILVACKTKHGYEITFLPIQVSSKTYDSFIRNIWNSNYPKVNYNDGLVELKFLELPQSPFELWRASELSNYSQWIKLDEWSSNIISNQHVLQDLAVNGREKYKYRIIKRGTGGDLDRQHTSREVEMHYDDIFLSDKDYMFAIRYNPKISSFKWVTQDSITNTLGGRYPFIRRNGDQYYRQFSLSGTLYLDWLDNGNSYCSIASVIMEDFFPDEHCSLYLSENTKDLYYRNVLKSKMRNIAAEFLNNGGVKLFRSEEEGVMLVYLSNVQFTPNTASGRGVWDFSATVTEVCEATQENIAKFMPNRMSNGKFYINACDVE